MTIEAFADGGGVGGVSTIGAGAEAVGAGMADGVADGAADASPPAKGELEGVETATGCGVAEATATGAGVLSAVFFFKRSAMDGRFPGMDYLENTRRVW